MTFDQSGSRPDATQALIAEVTSALAHVDHEAWRSEMYEQNEPAAPDIFRVYGDDSSLEATPLMVQLMGGAAELARYLTAVSPANVSKLLKALELLQSKSPQTPADELALLKKAYAVHCGDEKPSLDTAFDFAAGFIAARRLLP